MEEIEATRSGTLFLRVFICLFYFLEKHGMALLVGGISKSCSFYSAILLVILLEIIDV
jgi:hypothetical protein